ncbi:hypothetical protein T07_5216 [Trichinella nelsoni]|uniref:Uncharacterized protein n=1 Tax=Trichinella nelsoni TaxID=6336 RepID=A0A0V0SFF3_9BILA|nr:hypothetical protein T07_5216 [Trichinella nelsoni]
MDSIITNTGVSEKYTMKQEFVTTPKNKQKLVHRGRCYTLKRTNQIEKLPWHTVHKSGGHRSDPLTTACRVETVGLREYMRPVMEIYDELASNASTSLETAAHFLMWDQTRHTMYNRRVGKYRRLPAIRQKLQLTAEHTATKSDEQFLMYHLPTNDILIFATEAGVRLLIQSNCWCGDGTFKIVPSWKDLSMYSRIFEVLLSKAEELGAQLDLAKFVWDFETDLIPAIQGNFPNTRVQGGKKKVKMLMALAFLPVNLVPAGFEIINVGSQLEALFRYFQLEGVASDHENFASECSWCVYADQQQSGRLAHPHDKRARKHHLGFYQFLQLIIDE